MSPNLSDTTSLSAWSNAMPWTFLGKNDSRIGSLCSVSPSYKLYDLTVFDAIMPSLLLFLLNTRFYAFILDKILNF